MNISIKLTKWIFSFLLILLPFHALLANVNLSVFNYSTEILLALIVVLNLPRILTNLIKKFSDNTWLWIYVLYCMLIGLIFSTGIKEFIYGIKYEIFFVLIYLLFTSLAGKIDFSKSFKLFYKSSLVAIVLSLIIWLFTNNQFLVELGYRNDWSTFYLNENQAICQKIQDSWLCRFQGFLSSPNHFGLHLLFLFVLSSSVYMKTFLGLLVLPTFSRSSLIALALWIGQKISGAYKAMFKKVLAVALLTVLAYSFLFAFESSKEHFMKVFTNLDLILENLWFGNGLNFAGPASRLTQVPLVPESHFMQVILNTGLIGFGLFIKVFYDIYRRSRKFSKEASYLLLALLFPMLVLHPLEDTVLCVSVFSYLALLEFPKTSKNSE